MDSEHMPISQNSQNYNDQVIFSQNQSTQYQGYSATQMRILYTLSVLIFAFFMGFLHFYFTSYDLHSLHSKAFSHQDHQIYINTQFPHDQKCYTQGLSFINRTHLLESCGLYGKSYFKILEYNRKGITKEIVEVYRSQFYPQELFLQGSIKFPANGLIYILTWRERVVLMLEEREGKLVEKGRLHWNHPGWGLTHNNTHLILSQGSSSLYITNEKMQLQEVVNVADDGEHPVSGLNQLQYVNQKGHPFVYANVYPKDLIIKIDLLSGKVIETYKITNVVDKQPQAKKNDQVLNGIAYDPYLKTFLLTGKRWKHFYLIQAF